MKITFTSILLSCFLAFPLAADEGDHKANFQRWARLKSPFPGQSESIGSYSAGCLKGGKKLDLDGTGYSVMRLSRQRYYGHPNLISFIKDLGKEANRAGLPRVLVGDLGRAMGGPMVSGHASHQSGLDVDIWFRFASKVPSRKEREGMGATSYVNRDGSVTKAWSKQQRTLLALAAGAEEVERIFVHAGIKRDMCKHYPDAPWLHKLRPWWGHDDHLHVRLKCPEGSGLCENQEPSLAGGAQCGSEIDWWFSEEAKEEWSKKRVSIGRVFPKLPAACEEIAGAALAKKEGL